MLSLIASGASAWRWYRDGVKEAIGTTPVDADSYEPSLNDSGAISIAGPFFYAVRGLSPCSLLPGP